jgi:AcrR family transcriptional regulator
MPRRNIEALELLPGQIETARLLFEQTRITDVAKKVGVSRQTIYNWLADPSFALYIRDEEARRIEGVARRVVCLAEDAVNVLDRAMSSDAEDKPDHTAMRAVDIVLKRLPSLVQLAIVNVRLAEMERSLSQMGATLDT